jgi:hypothetical protein
MRRFTGTILKGGQVVLPAVSGTIQHNVNGYSGIQSWTGDFVVPPGMSLPAGENYHLVTEDGREGDILVRSVSQSSSGPTVADFIACGPIQ